MAVCASQGSMGLHNQQYHLITTDNKHLQGVGLGSFTARQLWEKLAYNKVLSVGAAPGWVPGATSMSRQDLWNTIMQAGSQRPQVDTDFNVPWFLRWDSKKMKYSKVLLSAAGAGGDAHPYGGLYPSLLMAIDWNYKIVTGQGTDSSWARPAEFLIDVKTSQDGGITWKVRMHITYQPGCTIEIEPTFRLRLFDGPLKRTERTLMNRGGVDIAMVPHHASSTPDKPVTYSPARGDEKKSDGGGENKPGYATMPVEEGGDRNPRNVQTGELKVTHNKNTGQFEAGTTQIMARMLTDVSAVNLRPINTDTIHTSEPADWFDTSMESYTGDNSRGKAVPMSIHNGNPHQFGPNWVDPICEGNRKHIIDVINRSPESFSAGDLVMCTNIDGRWYIQSFGKAGNKYFRISRWSFQHIITDSANFFRDDLYGSKPETHPRTLSSENYEENFRSMFYYDLADQPPGGLIGIGGVDAGYLAAMAAANIDVTTMNTPALRSTKAAAAGAWQMTSFDLVGTQMGGKNPNGNLIGRTNIHYDSLGEAQSSSEDLTARFLYPFWGATFTDGYDNGRLKDMRKNGVEMSPHPQLGTLTGGVNNFLSSNAGAGSLFRTDADVQNYGGIFGGFDAANPPNYTVNQANDGKQIPADIALNSSPAGENGRPLEDFTHLKLYGSPSRITSLPKNLQSYFARHDEAGNQVYGKADDGTLNGEQIRYNWLSTSGNWTSSTYDLAPVSPNQITFIPLTAELVAMEDKFRHINNANHVWWKDARKNLGTATTSAPAEGAFVNSSWWDRNRTGLVIFDSSCDNTSELTTYSSSSAATGGRLYPKGVGAIGSPANGIPYDWHIAQAKYSGGCQLVGAKNMSAAIGADWWESAGGGGEVADCVGIVAAKCQIQAKGEAIELSTRQSIGLPSFGTVSGGSDDLIILPIPSMPGWGGGSYIFENTTPQWGNSNDGYNTFGTTALHGKLYDQWPEEQTIYDPRYFAVMHFNEGQIGEPVSTKTDEDGVVVDVKTYTVDFKVPIYKSGAVVAVGSVAYRKAGTPIVAGVELAGGSFDELADYSKWKVNPIRRGMLLPCKYLKRTIGVRPGANHTFVKTPGTGYTSGDRFTSSGGSGSGATGKVTVGAGGGITGVEFDIEDGIQKLGQDYEPGDFALYSGNTLEDDGSVTLLVDSENGSGAVIICKTGLVYDAIKVDEGPKKQGTTAKLSLGSANGDGNKNGRTIGNKVSSIGIDTPSQHGIYDLFLYFHNDIGHTMANASTYAPMFQQYISLEVNIQ